MDESLRKFHLKRFRFAVVVLACHTWTLSCLLERVSLGPLQLLETLGDVITRLRLMSSLFLTIRSKLIWNRADAVALEDVKNWGDYLDAGLGLERLFLHFKPVYALCFALNDYNGTGGTGWNKAHCVLVAKGTEEIEIEPRGAAACKILENMIYTCEWRILEIFCAFEPLSDDLSHFRASINPTIPELNAEPASSDWEHELEQTVPDYLIRVTNPSKPSSDETPLFEDIKFTCDGIQVVIVEQLDLKSFLHKQLPKAPNLMRLQLRKLDRPILDKFVAVEESLLDLQELTLVLTYLAAFRQKKCYFSTIFEGHYTKEDDKVAGRFLLRDNQLVSIGYGRRKSRQLYLFENWLIFSRPREDQQVIVQKVPIQNLLLVFYRRQNVGAGILTVYWNQGGSEKQNVCSADIFFDDASALIIWAGVLSAATTAPVNSSADQDRPNEGRLWPTWPPWPAPPRDRFFKYLLDLGPLSVQQALQQLLPSLRNQRLHPEDSTKILTDLTALGKDVYYRQHTLGKHSSFIRSTD